MARASFHGCTIPANNEKYPEILEYPRVPGDTTNLIINCIVTNQANSEC